jgi:hypothetical protein
MQDDCDLRIETDLAEMPARSGLLGGSAPPMRGSWVPLYLELDGEVLRWAEFADIAKDEWPRQPRPRGALDAFIRIGSGRDVLRFARRWGTLLLCEHERPGSHDANCRPTRAEPVGVWLDYVELVRSILAAAAAIRQGEPAPREVWETLFYGRRRPSGWLPDEEVELLIAKLGNRHPGALAMARLNLKPFIDLVVTLSDLRPEIELSGEREPRSSLRLGGCGVLGVLGVQLLAAIGGAQGLWLCDACGQPYVPRRKPRSDRAAYCDRPECKRSGARLRKRAQRAQKAALEQ